jgi:hypothetical protein
MLAINQKRNLSHMDNLFILKFAEARQPEYREKKGTYGGYMEFGYHNDYPKYLLDLYNKSAKHNAIVKGKVNYIIGNGWKSNEPDAVAESFIKKPNQYESLADLTRKVSTDIEVFGGAYLEIVWSAAGGQLYSVGHIDYTKIRTNKDNTQFWFKSDWQDRKEEPVVINAFNSQLRQGRQILYMKEYRPGLETYSLPGYMGALNYIESDIEVSKHVLGNAQTGFSASKLVTLPNGEPTPDEKRNIERRFSDRFTGSDGKKLILSFVDRADQKPIVEDLGQSDLTKEDFANVDTLIQTNIFAGHQIVSPVLFGIKTEGQLGATTELQSAYEIFKNTYANDKQHFIESVFNELATIKGATSEIVIIPVEPISFQLTEAALLQIAPKEYLLEKAGIDLSKYAPIDSNTGELAASPANVNESLKNLTGRQYQQLMRVVRQFSQGKITKQQASVMLSGGLGLSEAEINTMLGVDDDPETEDQFSEQEDEAVKIFEEYGEQREFFNVFRDKPVYSSFEAFVIDNSIDGASDKKILELIKKDPLIAAAVLAKAIGKEVEFVYDRLQHLQDIGAIVKDEVTQARTLTRPINEIIDEPLRTTIEVRYSYEWKKVVPQGQRNSATHPSRPFCARLMQLDRLYTRREIEAISSRLGYSVFDRGGGWWTRPSGYHSPSCRHEWRANVVVKKK